MRSREAHVLPDAVRWNIASDRYVTLRSTQPISGASYRVEYFLRYFKRYSLILPIRGGSFRYHHTEPTAVANADHELALRLPLFDKWMG